RKFRPSRKGRVDSIRLRYGRDLADGDVAAPVALYATTEAIGTLLQIACGEPKAFQMPLVAVLGIVLVRGAAMKHMVIVDELHLARLEVHIDVEARIARHGADSIERFQRLGRNAGRFGMALRGPDVGRNEAHEQPLAMLG